MLLVPLFEKYRNGDFVQFCDNVLDTLTEPLAVSFKIDAKRQPFLEVIDRLQLIWQPLKGSDITPELQALDDQRDHIIDGLRITVSNWALHHFDPQRKEAAFHISEMINGYGNDIAKYRYQQQTATLNAIIQKLENDLINHVNLLNLADWVAQLKVTNTEFNNKFLERAGQIPQAAPGEVDALRTSGTSLYRELASAFDARYEVAVMDSSPLVDQFKAVEGKWNEITNSYNEAVTRYAQTEDTPPTPTP